MTYINRIGQGCKQTVDEFETRKEGRQMVSEYQMSGPSGQYYLSCRMCGNWKGTGPLGTQILEFF